MIFGDLQGDPELSVYCRRLVYKTFLGLSNYQCVFLIPIPDDFLLGTFHRKSPYTVNLHGLNSKRSNSELHK